jgi:hypothetical protein
MKAVEPVRYNNDFPLECQLDYFGDGAKFVVVRGH